MRIARGVSIANLSKPLGSSFDADAVAFFTAASITDTTQKSAVNQLVLDLKTANIWTKMKALYPVVGGVASSHAVNLKSPGTYNLTFATGWTHANTGMTPNGATYADTSINWLNDTLSDDISISVYSRTNNISSSRADIGAAQTTSPINYLMLQMVNSTSVIDINNGSVFTNIGTTVSLGLGLSSRLGTNVAYYNNNLIKSNITVANTGTRQSKNIHIGALNSPTPMYSNKQYAFASLGSSLNSTEASSFYTAVQNYQTTLGRQV